MFLKYFLYLLFVIFACGSFYSSQASDDAARARVERGVEYIRGQDAKRAALFKSKRPNVNILDITKNIYTLFKDPEKVSLIYGAEPHEKEAIFKAIMASAVLHVPQMGEDYHSYLDFYESNLELPRANDLRKHFEIIRYLNRFAKAVVKSSITGEFNEGQFYNFQMLLHESKVSSPDFFRWFSGICGEYGMRSMLRYLVTIENDYNEYIAHNEGRGREFSTHAVTQNEYFSADIAGNKFEFLVHKVSGNGTCGYYSLGITREEFGKFLKDNLHNAEIKEKILIALNDGYQYYGLGLTGLTLKSDSVSYEKLIDAYYPQPGHYLKTEEIELASASDIVSKGSDPGHYSIGKLKEIWNQKPLNQQVICVWTYASPGKLAFSGAYFQGKLIRKNDNGSMTLDPIGVPTDFTVEFKKLISENNIIHIYNNGYNHYDRLIVVSYEN